MRLSKWQNEATDALSWHQDEASSATIFLLREYGPTSFLLKEEDDHKKFKVSLGDPHTCTCSVFRKEKNPCKHICWIILKKLKVPRNNELAYQFGLVEREINQLLQGIGRENKTVDSALPRKFPSDLNDKKEIEQKPISDSDVCPICQEELLVKHLPVTYCKFGCGNSVHIKCMKIWADHQRQTKDNSSIKCPICREEFGSFYSLLEALRNSSDPVEDRLNVHVSTTCDVCHMSPVKGKCYKCTSCPKYFLCNSCFHANKHLQHSFVFRLKTSQRWRPVKSRTSSADSVYADLTFNDLLARDITENDYDLLLQLDRPQTDVTVPVDLSGLPEHIIQRLPVMRVRPHTKLLEPGKQCRLCLRSYEIGQYVRKLPVCKHLFHRECIDTWLSNDHRRCPIDNQVVVDPESSSSPASSVNESQISTPNAMSSNLNLMIPGIGIARLQRSFLSAGDSEHRGTSFAGGSGNVSSCLWNHRRTWKQESQFGDKSVANPRGLSSDSRIIRGRNMKPVVRTTEDPGNNSQKLDLWLTGSPIKSRHGT